MCLFDFVDFYQINKQKKTPELVRHSMSCCELATQQDNSHGGYEVLCQISARFSGRQFVSQFVQLLVHATNKLGRHWKPSVCSYKSVSMEKRQPVSRSNASLLGEHDKELNGVSTPVRGGSGHTHTHTHRAECGDAR